MKEIMEAGINDIPIEKMKAPKNPSTELSASNS